MRCFVTGCAGFIGSTLTDRLLSAGHAVVGFDNLSTGCEAFLQTARASANFHWVHGDTLDTDALGHSMRGAEFVFHLAANADVRYGTASPRKDLEQNTIATHNVLEAMRRNDIRQIAFASTGSVYGDATVIPTPEDAPFPIQTSFYAASKLACEGLIAAYCAGFGMRAHIFRLVSILGERYTHGHVFDFYRQLRRDPHVLRVLGDGEQRKSYLDVQDCITAMLLAIGKTQGSVNILNVGTDGYCRLNESIHWICQALGATPQLSYAGGDRGWVGDSPFIFLDTSRLRALGWQPQFTIPDAVGRTVRFLQENPWVLDARA